MGVPVTYCARCGLRLTGQDLGTGDAVARNGELFCRACAPALPGLDNPTVAAPAEHPTARVAGPPTPEPEVGEGSERLVAEGRRKRAERRLRSHGEELSLEDDLLGDEPFPWLLVLAGAGAALVIVVALALIFRTTASPEPAPDPRPVPAPTPPPPPRVPPPAPPPVPRPPPPPPPRDPVEEAKGVDPDATRAAWIAAACKTTETANEAALLAKRQRSDAACASLAADFESASARHACWEDENGVLTGFELGASSIERGRKRADVSARKHRFMILVEPGASRIAFTALAEKKPWKRILLRVFAMAPAPEETKDLATGTVKVVLNGAPSGELLFTDVDLSRSRSVELTSGWKDGEPNKVELVFGDGPSPVMIETIEVLALE